jgi:hypothetical protein
MKTKLIKIDKGYYNLEDKKGNVIGTTYQFSSFVGDVLEHKLFKQNCDEIFGVVNAKKLAIEHSESELSMYPETSSTLTESEVLMLRSLIQAHSYRGFEKGYNKAMALNKDKQFTEDDVITAIVHHTYLLYNDGKGYEDGDNNDDRIDYVIAALKQKTTEIEVEIEMEKVVDETKVIGAVKGVKGSGHKTTTYKSVPKLDADGCLMLKQQEQ